MLLEGLERPHKALRALSREPCARAPDAGQDAVHRRTRGGRVLARSPRSCRRGPQDFLLGHRARPSLGPPASSLPAVLPADLWRAAHSNQRQAPTLRAAWETRAGGDGQGCVFTFSNLWTSLRSFPVDTSARRSEPPTAAPSSPSSSPPVSLASPSLRLGLAAYSVPRARTRAPAVPRCQVHPLPELRGGASPQGETRRPGARKGDTRCLPRNS
ncbi:uncharacterized protein LOC120594511 isoform X1 [Pteropus medius]|uniref:uncharacterized protein LOC120594511 isoform X1 n=1 Tax=Pteropus vampyrus TaxID=132908 RepID=UPI00196A4FE1|nr:uncharacterized protein LOC120594511 isoform X1 [Pteropus giganteus]XP_039708481.1 uncharacterized protein LOC120594511 isoform X1 [Pteropus giganteus]